MRDLGPATSRALSRGIGISTTDASCSSVVVPCCVCVVRLTVAPCVLPAGPTFTRWNSCVSVLAMLVASPFVSVTVSIWKSVDGALS